MAGPRPQDAALRELSYRLRARAGTVPKQLPLVLAAAAPGITVETTVAHLDDDGDVWRTLTVQGTAPQLAQARAAFDAYRPAFVREKDVLGATPGRLVLWYKYAARSSHTALAFRMLGRDCVITDRTQGGPGGAAITVRLLARAGPALEAFLAKVRASPGLAVELVYLGPPRTAAPRRLAPAEEEAMRAAWGLGYYEVPRRAQVRAVAKALGVPATTASYRLRKAEAKLVAAAVEG